MLLPERKKKPNLVFIKIFFTKKKTSSVRKIGTHPRFFDAIDSLNREDGF